MDFEQFKYFRGYVISERPIESLIIKDWNQLKNDYYFFYFQENTTWEYKEYNDSTWGCIIGHCIDPNNYTDSLAEILNNSLSYFDKSNDNFYQYLETLVGRYVFILGKGKNVILLSDATSMKNIFYHQSSMIASSHAKLVSELTNEGLNPDIDTRWLGEYSSYHLPGHFTPFNNIVYLLPNHSLSWPSFKVNRYFPREPLNFDNSAEKVEELIYNTEQQLRLLSRNNKFIFSLSAGMDSRTSLSFMKDYLNQTQFFTYYFTDSNDPTYKGSSILNLDHKVVKDITNNLNLNHQFIPIDKAIETNDDFIRFKNVLKDNTFLNHSANLAMNYLNLFGTDNYLHIRSNLYEIGRPIMRNIYKFTQKEASVLDIVRCYSSKAVNDENVINLMKQYYDIYNPNNLFNYDPFDFVYWEIRMGAWHSQILIQSDVSHNTHIFMNSHKLLSLMLSFPLAMRKNGDLFKNIIEKKWPVLKFWDINKDKTLLDKYDPVKENYGMNLDNLVFKSGNEVTKETEVPLAYKQYEKSASFYIDKNAPKKGDYVEAIKTVKLNPNMKQSLILYLRSGYENPKNKGRIKYQVLIQDKVLLEEDIAFWKETNQIIIPLKELKDSNEIEVKVKVIAVKNCETWNWGKAGTIIIERICLRNNYNDGIDKVHTSSPHSKVLL